MLDIFKFKLNKDEFPKESILDISTGGKALIISDIHMGHGSRDDLDRNGEMLACILEEYYYKNGWILLLNGDIEELQKFSLDDISKKWANLFRVYDLFAKENRFYKIIGNHDDPVYLKRYEDYPYHLHPVVKIETGAVPAFVYHGHQLMSMYRRFNKLVGFSIRFILKPLGIKNISYYKNPYKRFDIEKKAYSFSIENQCLTIIGHTHRPLFQSLGRFDYIKFEIEKLCMEYSSSVGEERSRIEAEVKALRKDLSALKKKEKRDVLRQSLYGDELPVPCLFNSGCTLGKQGINGIEISNKDIALAYWFTEGKSKKFVTRGGYKIEEIPNTPYRRAVLNYDNLDYIAAKIKLLG